MPPGIPCQLGSLYPLFLSIGAPWLSGAQGILFSFYCIAVRIASGTGGGFGRFRRTVGLRMVRSTCQWGQNYSS